jgi:urease accessory protein
VAVQFMKDGLRFLADHVLGEMLVGLGLKVSALQAPFEPEGGAYGHQHAHVGEAPSSAPKIHSYSSS